MVAEGDEGDGTVNTVQSDPATEADTASEKVGTEGATAMGAGGPLERRREGRGGGMALRGRDGGRDEGG